jgi:hypothetical protein
MVVQQEENCFHKSQQAKQDGQQAPWELIAIPTAKERVPNTTTEESKGGRRRKKSPFDCLDPFSPILNLLSITTNCKKKVPTRREGDY